MPDFKLVDVTETPYLYAEGHCSMDPADISKAMEKVFHQVWGFMEARGIAPAGPALAVYHDYSPDTMAFRCGFAIAHADMAKAEDPVKADATPAARVLHFVHKGPYRTLRDDYAKLMEHAEKEGLAVTAPSWELYLNDPSQVLEADLVTEAYVSVAQS